MTELQFRMLLLLEWLFSCVLVAPVAAAVAHSLRREVYSCGSELQFNIGYDIFNYIKTLRMFPSQRRIQRKYCGGRPYGLPPPPPSRNATYEKKLILQA